MKQQMPIIFEGCLYGIPVCGFCSEECAVEHGYRAEVFSGAYETDGDAIDTGER